VRPHSETLPPAAKPIIAFSFRYLIYSQALTRNILPATTGHVLAMNSLGDTAENTGRILLGMRASSFTISLPESWHPGFVFFARLENTTRLY